MAQKSRIPNNRACLLLGQGAILPQNAARARSTNASESDRTVANALHNGRRHVLLVKASGCGAWLEASPDDHVSRPCQLQRAVERYAEPSSVTNPEQGSTNINVKLVAKVLQGAVHAGARDEPRQRLLATRTANAQQQAVDLLLSGPQFRVVAVIEGAAYDRHCRWLGVDAPCHLRWRIDKVGRPGRPNQRHVNSHAAASCCAVVGGHSACRLQPGIPAAAIPAGDASECIIARDHGDALEGRALRAVHVDPDAASVPAAKPDVDILDDLIELVGGRVPVVGRLVAGRAVGGRVALCRSRSEAPVGREEEHRLGCRRVAEASCARREQNRGPVTTGCHRPLRGWVALSVSRTV
eukprot:1814455-Prymnesium_polylepis.2